MTLVDATCPDVARIQAAIRKYARRGYFTVIFGDPGHAEVTGLLGYTAGRGFVVTTPADVLALPDVSPVCLCAQSTQFPDDYEEIARVARTKFGDLVVLDTICDATKNRQRELQEIAAGVDAIVVVGSRQSANTLRLVELARRLKPTFHIQTREDLRKEDFRGYRTIGVTAGASTPDPVIQAVRRALEEMEECCSPSDVTSA
jgi:4-hydroxy-3-methylbut-2-enyl diphosphate reductase